MTANKTSLTAEQQFLKAEYQKRQKALGSLDEQRNVILTGLGQLFRRCHAIGHAVPERDSFDESETAISGTAICDICGPILGWYCAKNPKHYCEYDDKHGECCIHCGLPLTRK